MIGIKIICVGKCKEKFFQDAFEEYRKRLGAYSKFDFLELSEYRLPASPSDLEISDALNREADNILAAIPPSAFVISLCVEGKSMTSTEFSDLLSFHASHGVSKFCFIIGGSYGLSPRIKELSSIRLSMSKMTFPHHLARVMLAEQIYRAFKIQEGSRYHK